MDDLDPQVIAALARAVKSNPELRSAAAAIFAALKRTDKEREREREAWAIVKAVSEVNAGYSLIDGDCMLHGGCSPEWVGPASDKGYWQHHPDCPVTRARALLGGENR